MWQKNNGKNKTEILQNQFTAYLVQAIQRRRMEYIRQMDRQRLLEKQIESFLSDRERCTVDDVFSELPLFMQLESNVLYHALKELNERERYIFLAHVLDEKSFQVLAAEMSLSYKGVAAVYYRTLRKVAKKLKGTKI